MTSSYTKISRAICKTPEWVDFENAIVRRLQTFRLSTATFEPVSSNHANVVFRTIYDGASSEYSVWVRLRSEVEKYQLDISDLVGASEIVRLVNKLWVQTPRPFPTYNCKLEKSKTGPKDQSYILKHFVEFAYVWLQDHLSDAISDAEHRVRNAMVDFYDLPGFEERKKREIERIAIRDIREALMKYRYLDHNVLRTAFNEFLVDDVLTQ